MRYDYGGLSKDTGKWPLILNLRQEEGQRSGNASGEKKKKTKLVWKDEQEFARKIRGHIPVRGNSVSKHKNMQKCVLRLESQNHLAEAQGK